MHNKNVGSNANSINFNLTLTMVPDGIEGRATARLTGFWQRKKMIASFARFWRPDTRSAHANIFIFVNLNGSRTDGLGRKMGQAWTWGKT